MISLDLKLNSSKNEKRLQTELKMNDEILNEIEVATTRIAKAAIKDWEKKQKGRNPDDFKKTN